MIVHVNVDDLEFLMMEYRMSLLRVDEDDPRMKEFFKLADRLNKKIDQAEERERRKLEKQCLRMLKNENT